MSEQDELLLTEIRDMLLEFLATCITGGVPLEIAEIRAKDILAKAKPIIEKQERKRIYGILGKFRLPAKVWQTLKEEK